MSTFNHTAITTGAAANAATFNTPLSQLDAKLGDLSGFSLSDIATILAAALDVDGTLKTGAIDTSDVLADFVADYRKVQATKYLHAYTYQQTAGALQQIGAGFSDNGRQLQRRMEPAIAVGSSGAWDDGATKDPCLVRGPDNIWYCYFSGYDGALFDIGVATSGDGLTWAKYSGNPILAAAGGWESTSIHHPVVLYDEEETDATKRWKMWYGGGGNASNAMGYAYSSDGLSWTKYAGNNIMAAFGSGWESTYILPRAVVKLDGLYHLFYNGYNGSTWQGGVVIFRNPEDKDALKYRPTWNPICSGDGITALLTANMDSGTSTLTVADASAFKPGMAVWVGNGGGRTFTHVKSTTGTTITVEDTAAANYTTAATSVIRSIAYSNVLIDSVRYEQDRWIVYCTGQQPGTITNPAQMEIVFTGDSLRELELDYSVGAVLRPTFATRSSIANLSGISIVPVYKAEGRLETTRLRTRAVEPAKIKATRYLGAYNFRFVDDPYQIAVAFSDDLRNWQRTTEPAIGIGLTGTWEDGAVKDPSAVVGPDGMKRIYYSGQDGSVYKIGYAYSGDGLIWTKYASNPVISASQAWENSTNDEIHTPVVIYDREEANSAKKWKMWYSGGQFGAGGIGYAYSADGITWTKYASNPVLTKGAGGQWDDTYVLPSAVVKSGSTWYLFYGGNDGATWQVGLATFSDPETAGYTKSGSNPVLASDGITQDLTANMVAGDTTVTVADSSDFVVGMAVWIGYNTSETTRYLTHVRSVPDSTTIEVEDAAPAAYSTANSSTIKSAANNSLTAESVFYDGTRWILPVTGFQVNGFTGLVETTVLAYGSAETSLEIDYSAGVLIRPATVAETQDNISLENLSVVDLHRHIANVQA